MSQQQAEKYRKQQEAKEREMLEKSKDFDFINLMLRSLGMGEQK